VTSPTQQTTAAWRAANETKDLAGITACLADGARLISPLTAQFTFEGRAQVRAVMAAAFEVIDEIRFHTEVADGPTCVLVHRGTCGGEEFEEAQLLRFDDAGQIAELTFFGRPLPGLLRETPGRARLVKAATAPLAAITKLGDRRIVPLANPNRATRS
jgi:hypothetical protein